MLFYNNDNIIHEGYCSFIFCPRSYFLSCSRFLLSPEVSQNNSYFPVSRFLGNSCFQFLDKNFRRLGLNSTPTLFVVIKSIDTECIFDAVLLLFSHKYKIYSRFSLKILDFIQKRFFSRLSTSRQTQIQPVVKMKFQPLGKLNVRELESSC